MPSGSGCIFCASDDFSFFRYAEEIAPLSAIGRTSPPIPLRHIFSQMRYQKCSLVIEEEVDLSVIPWCEDEVKLFEETIRAELVPLSRRLIRITFLAFQGENPAEVLETYSHSPQDAKATFAEDAAKLKKLVAENNFFAVGYAFVIVDSYKGTVLSSYVPVAVLKPSLPEDAGVFVHSKGAYVAEFLGEKLPVEGSYFVQQEGAAWCCAHAATIVAINNIAKNVPESCGGKANTVEYLCPLTMNKMLNINHRSRLASNGLFLEEVQFLLKNAVKDFSIESSLWDTQVGDQDPDLVIDQAYYAVECGLPAIIGFHGNGVHHAMAVVGHTFDQVYWSSKASGAYFGTRRRGYIPSHAWVDKLIVQDDNFGPYSTLSRSELARRSPSIVVPRFPGSSVYSADQVEVLAHLQLQWQVFDDGQTYFQQVSTKLPRVSDVYWFNTLQRHLANQLCVLRTTPIIPDEYINWLEDSSRLECKQKGIADDEVDDYIDDVKRHKILGPTWLVEVSIPELYQWNNFRLGEVLIQELYERPDEPVVWLVRMPGVLSLPDIGKNMYDHRQIPMTGRYSIERRTPAKLGQYWNWAFDQWSKYA